MGIAVITRTRTVIVGSWRVWLPLATAGAGASITAPALTALSEIFGIANDIVGESPRPFCGTQMFRHRRSSSRTETRVARRTRARPS